MKIQQSATVAYQIFQFFQEVTLARLSTTKKHASNSYHGMYVSLVINKHLCD